jgi:predicted ribosome quality control (RQC) complex YloA/Tae2 family protein
MPFDGFVLAAIRQELEEKITSSRIDRIYQPSPESLVLNLHRSKERLRLFLSAHPTNARIHLLSLPMENPLSPPLFCMVLRKHLEGGRIKKIVQPGLERILILEVEAQNEAGAATLKHLICEIMGKHSNIILIEAHTRQIVDACRRYSHALSRYREVLPGRTYLSPPTQNKLDPLNVQKEEFYQALLTRPLDNLLAECMQSCLDGLSRTLGREIVYRAGLPAEMPLDECGEYELHRLWQALQEIAVPAGQNKFDPTLIFDHKGKTLEFAACDLTCFTGLNRKKNTMNALVDHFFLEQEATAKIEKERQFLLKLLHKETSRMTRKLTLQNGHLNTVAQAEEFRIYGELLMANLHQVKRGLPEVALENFYDPANHPVNIPLKPQLSPVENAQIYFKKYTKSKHACKIATSVIEQVEKELAYLASVETALQMASFRQELAEVREELTRQGYLQEKIKSQKIKKDRETPQPLAFTLSEGFTALVGKTNRQNDYLTMRLAKDDDIWLHTKDIPGAHVIVRIGRQPLTHLALQEAACLAAYHSQARQSQNVPVDYTSRKNVNKPRGAKPGFVIYTGQRTINVDPDKELVDRMAKQTATPD